MSRQEGEELLAPEGLTEIWVSQDNCGGYVLTGKWMENE